VIEKNRIDIFVGSLVGIETENGNYFKGYLREVNKDSILLEFLNGRKFLLAISKINSIKEASI